MNIRNMLLAVLSLFALFPAQAFESRTRSENPAITEPMLLSATNRIAVEVGNTIPQDPDIKVYVYTRAIPSKSAGQYIYFHRIQLTKAFSGGAPYPYQGWLPIRTVEVYGVDYPDTIRSKLDDALRTFFQSLKNVDPQTDGTE